MTKDIENKPDGPELPDPVRAKRYARIKLASSLTGLVIYVVFTLGILFAGYTRTLETFFRGWVSNDYLVLLLFSAALAAAGSALNFPLSYAVGYRLERRYGLSDQGFGGWLWHGVKGKLVGAMIGTPILLVFYLFLVRFGEWWWLPTGALLFFVSVLLGRLAPTLIFPIFYKFEPVPDGRLVDDIRKIAGEAGMKLEGIYSFNLSKTTKKANAAFAGLGRSKRILLSDTLLDLMTDGEVLTVLAHELGHYRLRHIPKLIATGAVTTFTGLFLAAQAYSATLGSFGFSRVQDIGALPLISLWLMLYSFVTGPVSNSISRKYERQADRFALELSRDGEAYTSALKRLAEANLADVDPHPFVEFFFHSHPSIKKRLATINEYESTRGEKSNGMD